MKRALCAALAMLAFGGAAQAATPYELYVQGKFKDAIAAGIAQNSAQGFALAARAELAAETMGEKRCPECVRRAQQDARNAIAADPKLPDGHIFLAVALGQEGRQIGNVVAGARGYPTQAKKELDTALAGDPSNAFAWAALGGWNIEIVRGGGASLAQWIYGANLESGFSAFNKAFAIAPGEVVLRYQYALALSAYDLIAYRETIEKALTLARDGTPQGVYESFAQNRATELLGMLKANRLSRYRTLLHRDQGYPVEK